MSSLRRQRPHGSFSPANRGRPMMVKAIQRFRSRFRNTVPGSSFLLSPAGNSGFPAFRPSRSGTAG